MQPPHRREPIATARVFDAPAMLRAPQAITHVTLDVPPDHSFDLHACQFSVMWELYERHGADVRRVIVR